MRETMLRAMTGPELIIEADKLGVKVRCDKARKKLVEAKAALVDRILAFEAEQAEAISANAPIKIPAPKEITTDDIKDAAPTPKRGALVKWNGKAQNICAWAEELGISPNTLYGRIYKLGWTIDKAFTTKGRK